MSSRSYSDLKAQRMGKERDMQICQVCGSTVSPQGHHIINHQYGGSASVNNIVTLCQRCHKQVHRGNIDILTF